MTDDRGFRADGTHIDTGVARDPQGFNQAGEHISESTNTRGLRGSQPQPRQQDGKFAEKTGTSPEVALVDEATVGILGETPSQYARRSQRFEQLVHTDLRIAEDDTVEATLRYSEIDADSLLALMHAGVEEERKPENLASFPEVDELYAQAAAAEARLVSRDFRMLLAETRPGTKNVLIATYNSYPDIDIAGYENEDGSVDPVSDREAAINDYFSRNYNRVDRILRESSVAAVPESEARSLKKQATDTNPVNRILGHTFYRIGESS